MIDDEQVLDFQNNFSAIKRLEHPSIISYKALFYDLKKHNSHLVMEYVDFPSLKAYTFKSENEVKTLMFNILSTLNYMHKKQVCHRDLKPDNILYNPETLEIKIIDLQLAKTLVRRHKQI